MLQFVALAVLAIAQAEPLPEPKTALELDFALLPTETQKAINSAMAKIRTATNAALSAKIWDKMTPAELQAIREHTQHFLVGDYKRCIMERADALGAKEFMANMKTRPENRDACRLVLFGMEPNERIAAIAIAGKIANSSIFSLDDTEKAFVRKYRLLFYPGLN